MTSTQATDNSANENNRGKEISDEITALAMKGNLVAKEIGKMMELIGSFKKEIEHIQKVKSQATTTKMEKHLVALQEIVIPHIMSKFLAEFKTSEKYKDFFDTLESKICNIGNDLDGKEFLNELTELSTKPFKDEAYNTGTPEGEKYLSEMVCSDIAGIFKANEQRWQKDIIDKVEITNFSNIKEYLENVHAISLIDDLAYEAMQTAVTDRLLEISFPEVKSLIDDLLKYLENQKNKLANKQVEYESKNIAESKITDIKNKVIEIKKVLDGGSNNEETFKRITDDYESEYKKKVSAYVDNYINEIIVDMIDDCSSESQIDKISTTKGFEFVYEWIKELDGSESDEYKERIDKILKEAKINILLKVPTIRVKNEMVHFGSEQFPVYIKKSIPGNWKIDPKISGENVILNLVEQKSKKKVIPDDERRMDFQNPFEVTRAEYKEMMRINDAYKKGGEYDKMKTRKDELLAQLEELRKAGDADKDRDLIEKLRKEVKEIKTELNSNIPHVFRMIEAMNRFTAKEKLNSKLRVGVPDISDKIIITPDVMDNLHKIISKAKSQQIRQDGISILEGEAGVGKNVLLDIFAHYTNRPVFTFPCNKRASKEDLTYQWLIDEAGTYKLHSKVYEAIITPGALLIFDEINTLPSEVIKLLNGLFDYRRTLNLPYDNEYLKADKSVLIFGTQNPTHYLGTEKLPQDTSSRANTVIIDYPTLTKDVNSQTIYNYDEALKTYMNVPYFHKLLELNGIKEELVKEVMELKLKKSSNHKISAEEEEKIIKVDKGRLTVKQFITLWNDIFNLNKDNTELKNTYGENAIEGMKDIFLLMQYSEYIRNRYKEKMQGTNKGDKISASVSQRDLNKMLEMMCDGISAKSAFIEVYCSSVNDLTARSELREQLKSKNF